MSLKILSLSILAALFFIGCGGGSGSSGEPEVINGFTLPPEPDPVINNSTLLGIDSNNNGVRDDVERVIVKEVDNSNHEYKKHLTNIFLEESIKYNDLLKNF